MKLHFYIPNEFCWFFCFCFCFFFQRKRSAVGLVKKEAQEVLGEGERLLDEANQLSDNINKEVEVETSPK